jgi:hypothetical protein
VISYVFTKYEKYLSMTMETILSSINLKTAKILYDAKYESDKSDPNFYHNIKANLTIPIRLPV